MAALSMCTFCDTPRELRASLPSTSDRDPDKASSGSDAPGRSKAPQCQHFAVGRCKFGAKCKFSHTAANGRGTVATAERGAAAAARPCVDWQAGRCRFGLRCKFAHATVADQLQSDVGDALTDTSSLQKPSAVSSLPALDYSMLASLVHHIHSTTDPTEAVTVSCCMAPAAGFAIACFVRQVLVFVPGIAEIRSARAAVLARMAAQRHELMLVCLHSSIAGEQTVLRQVAVEVDDAGHRDWQTRSRGRCSQSLQIV